MLGPRSEPSDVVTLMASPAGSEVAALLPWVDATTVERVVWQDASARLELDPGGSSPSWPGSPASGSTRRSSSPASRSHAGLPAYACYLAGVPLRAAVAGDFGGHLLTHVAPPAEREAHQVDRNLHLLEALGFATSGRHLEQVNGPAWRAGRGADEEGPMSLGKPSGGVCVGSGS